MRNNILREDLDKVIDHLSQNDPILTNGPNVLKFEEEWSNWLGVKYSVFVNSGASANLISLALLKDRFPEGGEVIVPPLTWISDIASVIQNGFTPIFVDINPDTLGMDNSLIINKINESTRAVFISHIQGFNALTDDLINFLKERKILLIEDVCESHGATHNQLKLGSIGWLSNFSFYYAHHMSTIEGGMVCTNDQESYEKLRMLRSHGMVREIRNTELKNTYILNNEDLNPDFIFALAGYNVRNTEIGAILGLSQLKRLDKNCEVRTKNLNLFLNKLDDDKYKTNFRVEGSSNYAFNLILKNNDSNLLERLMHEMKKGGIEYRRGSAGGGNQLRQPYLRKLLPSNYYKFFPQTEHIHFYGFYLGNYPDMKENEISEILAIINKC